MSSVRLAMHFGEAKIGNADILLRISDEKRHAEASAIITTTSCLSIVGWMRFDDI